MPKESEAPKIGPSASAPAIAAANERAAQAVSSTATVLVGCKLPWGLVMEIHPQPAPPRNAAEVTLATQSVPQIGEQIILKGANSVRKDSRKNQGIHPYAVTSVPRDFWEAWLAIHKERPYVRRGLVFLAAEDAQPDNAMRNATAACRERVGEATGLEGLNQDPRKDPRMDKSTQVHTRVTADVEGMQQAS